MALGFLQAIQTQHGDDETIRLLHEQFSSVPPLLALYKGSQDSGQVKVTSDFTEADWDGYDRWPVADFAIVDREGTRSVMLSGWCDFTNSSIEDVTYTGWFLVDAADTTQVLAFAWNGTTADTLTIPAGATVQIKVKWMNTDDPA